MTKKECAVVSVIIWLLAVASLFAIRSLRHGQPNLAVPVAEAQGIVRSLDEQHRRSLRYYDAGLIRLGDQSFHLVGDCAQSDEGALLASQKVSIKRIDFQITDQLLLERQTMVRQALLTLNQAEKKCFIEGFATVIFRDGAYYLVYDQRKYAEYALKYGTECRTCEEMKKLAKGGKP